MSTEFEFIRNIKEKYGLNRIGDDCAILPKDSTTDLLMTADLMVENIDFRLDWTTPRLLGLKAAAVSLSDIAAMGGTPKWAMLTIGAPDDVWKKGVADGLFDGYFRMTKKFGVEMVGGDISRSESTLVIDSIVGGEVQRGSAVTRAGAKPGDGIFVTGPLGGSAGGLQLLRQGVRWDSPHKIWEARLLSRHLNPVPEVRVGDRLRELGVSAMIDISDGLSSDLGHICDASGVGAVIEADAIPRERRLRALQLTEEQELELALHGGEDFELLFTADEKKIPHEDLARFHRMGSVTEEAGTIELAAESGRHILDRHGYRHF